MYTIYVNDFAPNFVNYHVTGYADDTNLLISNNDKFGNIDLNNKNIKGAIEKCNQWFGEHNLVMNKNKTVLISFHNKKSDVIHVSLENCIISSEEHVKFLGIYVDNHLNWKYNTDKLCNKL
jgi:hypothetical protein